MAKGTPVRFSPGVRLGLVGFVLAWFAATVCSEEVAEYSLKVAFLYNFALFTDWPPTIGTTLNLCVYGKDRFGPDLDALQDKTVGDRRIVVHRMAGLDSLTTCQIAFIADSAGGAIGRVLGSLRGATVLTVADSPGAVDHGVALNLSVRGDRITFEANLSAARDAHLNLSSKLLRLATEVRQ